MQSPDERVSFPLVGSCGSGRCGWGRPSGRAAASWCSSPIMVTVRPAVLAGSRAAARLRARAQPGQGLWSSRKAMELVNLTSPSLAEVIDEAHQGIDRFAARPAWPTRSWVTLAWPTPS